MLCEYILLWTDVTVPMVYANGRQQGGTMLPPWYAECESLLKFFAMVIVLEYKQHLIGDFIVEFSWEGKDIFMQLHDFGSRVSPSL